MGLKKKQPISITVCGLKKNAKPETLRALAKMFHAVNARRLAWGGSKPESGGKLLDGKVYGGDPIAGERHGDLGRAHNPDLAGSTPAPAIKRPH